MLLASALTAVAATLAAPPARPPAAPAAPAARPPRQARPSTRRPHAAAVASVSRLAFGPANVLFIADWRSARVHAVTLPAAAGDAAAPFNVRDLDAPLRRALGTTEVVLEDLAARPGTGEVYVAASVGARRTPAIVIVTPDGRVRRLDLAALPSTAAALEKPPAGTVTFWDSVPDRSFTVTDMQWHDGKLYVAGLSNQAFASTLRILPYPFGSVTARGAAIASVEMYHTSHNQMETRAPIRAMAFTEIDGRPVLLAAYLCTPLVTIPLDALRDGAHVTGKTIAELGDAGIPVNVVPFAMPDLATGTAQPMVLVANLNRPSDVIPLASIAEASRKPGYVTPVAFGRAEGVSSVGATLGSVLRVVDQSPKYLAVLRRDLATGRAQLVSVNKAAGFRLSDFDLSEYMFPDYRYTAEFQQKYIKPAQDMLKREEGFPQLVRP